MTRAVGLFSVKLTSSIEGSININGENRPTDFVSGPLVIILLYGIPSSRNAASSGAMAMEQERVGLGVDRVILFPEWTIEAAERRISATGENISSSTSDRMKTRRGERSNFLLWTIPPST